MSASFRRISFDLARRVRLIMTDVDGTLTADGISFSPELKECVARLRSAGIIVGLVSGRDLPRLESIVSQIEVNGPLIAENGGVARLSPETGNLDLGYSRRRALDALAKLKSLFGDKIVELEDNRNRLVDVTISVDGIPAAEIQNHLPGMQVMDSGYMLHLIPDGISKGNTLRMVASQLGISSNEIMVFGDSTTDISLFRNFANSVLVHNPLLSAQQRQAVSNATAFESDLEIDKGFCEVSSWIISLRTSR
jgi:hydroxymethylpyrimidine pyrophosphatase-like HAD family hydrolase